MWVMFLLAALNVDPFGGPRQLDALNLTASLDVRLSLSPLLQREPPDPPPDQAQAAPTLLAPQHDQTELNAREEHRGAGWIVAGMTGAILVGAWPGTLAIIDSVDANPNKDLGGPIALTILGAALLGTVGYFIGTVAEEGSAAAKAMVVIFDVLGVATVPATAAYVSSLHSGEVN